MGGPPYKSAKEGVGTLSTVSAFNHERAPMSCLQRLKALEANNCTQNNIQRNCQWHSVASSVHHISYMLLYAKMLCINFGEVLHDVS